MNLDTYIELAQRMMPILTVYVMLLITATYIILDMEDPE
jgi:hypothetical protein